MLDKPQFFQCVLINKSFLPNWSLKKIKRLTYKKITCSEQTILFKLTKIFCYVWENLIESTKIFSSLNQIIFKQTILFCKKQILWLNQQKFDQPHAKRILSLIQLNFCRIDQIFFRLDWLINYFDRKWFLKETNCPRRKKNITCPN